jgi:hypothetical protein
LQICIILSPSPRYNDSCQSYQLGVNAKDETSRPNPSPGSDSCEERQSEKWAFDFLNVIEPRALARAGFLGSLDDEGIEASRASSLDDEGIEASRASSHSIRAKEGAVDGRFTGGA